MRSTTKPPVRVLLPLLAMVIITSLGFWSISRLGVNTGAGAGGVGRQLGGGYIGAGSGGKIVLPLPVLRTRDEMLTAICEREPLRSAAEIGVQRAFFAFELLTRCPGITSYLGVDLWATQASYDDGANVNNLTQGRIYDEARERLKPFGDRWRLWRQDSVSAAAQVPDGSLDFVYLDARHDYRSVQDDIRAWAPKVRAGGIFAGHDYIDASEIGGSWTQYKDGSTSHPTKAVRSAVSEFADLTGRQHLVTYGDLWQNLPYPSWFMRM
jgi:hypothetical protein